MSVITIAEAKQRVGTTIIGISGKLVKLWKPKTGDGEYGPWSLQNGELFDGTGSIKVTFKNTREVPYSMRDKDIVIESTGGKHGLNGVQVKADDKTGEPVLWISKVANIRKAGEAPIQKEIAFPQKPEPKAAPAPREPRPDDMSTVKGELSRLANLYYLAREAAINILPEEPEDADTLRSATGCLFIEAVKQGLHNRIPTAPVVDTLGEERTWEADKPQLEKAGTVGTNIPNDDDIPF